jgi:hypothetical protein
MKKVTFYIIIKMSLVFMPNMAFADKAPVQYMQTAAVANIINHWKPEFYKDLTQPLGKKDLKHFNKIKLSRPFDGLKASAIFDVVVLEKNNESTFIRVTNISPLKISVNGKIYGPIDTKNIYKSLLDSSTKKTSSSWIEALVPRANAQYYRVGDVNPFRGEEGNERSFDIVFLYSAILNSVKSGCSFGYGNSGYGNSGYGNSGYGNSGYGNSGYGNSGYGNSGYGNSGYDNSGYDNSGYGNNSSYYGLCSLPVDYRLSYSLKNFLSLFKQDLKTIKCHSDSGFTLTAADNSSLYVRCPASYATGYESCDHNNPDLLKKITKGSYEAKSNLDLAFSAMENCCASGYCPKDKNLISPTTSPETNESNTAQ